MLQLEKFKSKKFVVVLLSFPLCWFGKIPPPLFLTIVLTYLTLDVAEKKIKDIGINIKPKEKPL